MPSHTIIPASPEAFADGLSDRRLQTPVRDFMRPGVIAVSEDASLRQAERAMVRHGVHAILVLGRSSGTPLGWVTSRGMLQWITHDLGLVPASRGMTESPTFIEPGATAQEAVQALSGAGVSHLLVTRVAGETPQGVVSDLDVIALCTRERR
ncbi:MAG: CBS domain-containing protein [Solirubrobacteraceae bacterium]